MCRECHAVTLADDASLPCPACGYDLRGLEAGRCPECGRAFTPAELAAMADLPWQRRADVGWRLGFWRTVRLAIRHPRRLAEQIGRDVRYRDARRFQFACCLIAWLMLAPMVVIAMMAVREGVMEEGQLIGIIVGGGTGAPLPANPLSILLDGLVLLACLAGVFAWLVTSTGLFSYFFHPRDLDARRQDRAIAMSYYAAAPLAWTPLPAIIVLVATIGTAMAEDLSFTEVIFVSLGSLLGFTLAGLLVGDVLLIAWTLLRHGLKRSLARAIAMCLGFLVGACVLFVICVVLPPILVLWLEAVILMLAK